MARLLSSEVRNARDKLKFSTDIATRDYIFADCYDELTSCWEAICQLTEEDIAKQPDDFMKLADGIAQKLFEIPKESRAATDLDSGGAYVATSVAIFYLWAHFSSPEDNNFGLKKMAKKGKDVLKPWLSHDEILCVEQGIHKSKQFDWGGRRRYLDWYDFLLKKSGGLSPLN